MPAIRQRINKGTVVHADESPAWNKLHARFAMQRINHQNGYSIGGACTNAAESYFSRLRGGELGHNRRACSSLGRLPCKTVRLCTLGVLGSRSICTPIPIANLWHVLTVLPDVASVIDEFVADELSQLGGAWTQPRHPVNNGLDQMKPVEPLSTTMSNGVVVVPLP